MAFDKTDPVDLLALKTEEATDPIGMGYAAAQGGTKTTLNFFNLASLNVGGETTITEMTVEVLLREMVPGDFDDPQVTEGERLFIQSLLSREFSEDIDRFKLKIIATLANNSQTETNLDALVRGLSRAEVLFGKGTVISKADWIAARDS